MKKIALAALLAASLGAAHAGVVTFEGVSTRAAVPNGYGGLNWSNFYTVNGADSFHVGTGYQHGLVSGTEVAFNSGGNPATVSASSAHGFDLGDAWFTGAWNDGLQIVASATFEDGTHASKTFLVNTSAPIDEFFNWNGLASVTFVSSGGKQNFALSGGGTHFALDNLNTALAVPEASNAALLLAGLGLLAVAARRRRAA